jgi:hypothetical protein
MRMFLAQSLQLLEKDKCTALVFTSLKKKYEKKKTHFDNIL